MVKLIYNTIESLKSLNLYKMKCQVCEYPISKANSFQKEGLSKKYNMCCGCTIIFNNKIILPKLNNLAETNISNFTQERSCKGIVTFILKYATDKDRIMQDINEIFDTEFTKLKNITKYSKPFENIEIYNMDGSFYCFTSLKNMNRLLKNERVDKLSDDKIKFKEQMDDGLHSLVIKQINNKKNECINCKKEEFLKKICIFPITDVNIFFKKNALIHFWHAVCTGCIDFCEEKKNICNTNIIKETGKTCIEHINELCETKNFEEMRKFIDYYTDCYQSIQQKNVSLTSSQTPTPTPSPKPILLSPKSSTLQEFTQSNTKNIIVPTVNLCLEDDYCPFSPILLSPSSMCSTDSDDFICESSPPKLDFL